MWLKVRVYSLIEPSHLTDEVSQHSNYVYERT